MGPKLPPKSLPWRAHAPNDWCTDHAGIRYNLHVTREANAYLAELCWLDGQKCAAQQRFPHCSPKQIVRIVLSWAEEQFLNPLFLLGREA